MQSCQQSCIRLLTVQDIEHLHQLPIAREVQNLPQVLVHLHMQLSALAAAPSRLAPLCPGT